MKQYQPGTVEVVTLKAEVVAVQVLPEDGQTSATGDPGAAVQLVLVLTLALGPQIWNDTEPVGAGALERFSGEMLSVAVSVMEAPAVTVPVLLAWVVSVDGCLTKKHSLTVVVLEEPV